MCICIYKFSGNDLPTKETLKRCYQANRDGAGFSYSYKGNVYTYKGFFDFDKFYDKLMDCDRKYDLKSQSAVLHFRISTHGLTNAANCHPFAVTSNEHKLKSTFSKSKFSVVHNGICSITSDISKKETLSDTALFVRDYLSKIATYDNWFKNPHTIELIENMIDSKMAILSGDGSIIATSGFHKGEDGNYYSNYSYMESSYGLYGYGFLEDWYADYYYSDEIEMPLMELKRHEKIIYQDGTVEEYTSGYHNLFKTYMNDQCEIYTLYEDVVGNRIPLEKLSFMGNGEIVDNFFYTTGDKIKPIDFRQDAVAVV